MNSRMTRQSPGKFGDWIEWLAELELALMGWKNTGRANGIIRLILRQEKLITMNSLYAWRVPSSLIGIVDRHADTVASVVNKLVLFLEHGITEVDREELDVLVTQLNGVRRWLRAHNGPADTGVKY